MNMDGLKLLTWTVLSGFAGIGILTICQLSGFIGGIMFQPMP